MSERILSIKQAAAETPWSESTLYRIAPEPDSPFHKRGGRWVTTESDLLEWVRTGPKPRSAEAGSPMPKPRSRRASSFGAKILQFERSA